MITVFLLTGLLVVLVRYLFLKRELEKRLPPGPKGHFLTGNAGDLDNNHPQVQIEKWKQEFGDIFRLRVAGNNIVVVSSEETVKDVLNKKSADFSGRYDNFRIRAINNFCDFVGFADDSPHWRHMKKAMVTSLKMYGDNLQTLQSLALETIKNFVDSVKLCGETAFNPSEKLLQLSSDFMSQLVFYDPFPGDFVNEFLDYENKTSSYYFMNGLGRELDLFPWLRFLGNKHWAKIKQGAKWERDFCSKLIQQRKKVLNLENPKCLIDALYKQHYEEKVIFGEAKLSETDIQMIVTEAIRAGIQTTFKAMVSFVAIATAYPKVQKLLQKEVDDVTNGRQLRLADKQRMPYTDAAVFELMRYISHVPLLVPHKSTKNSTLMKYLIPKGTQIWVNTYSLHHDERYWDDPWEFKPERFLDENGRLLTADHPKRRRLVAFGSGKRICPGEVLARNRMFLFLSSLMQNFSFRAAEGEDKPEHDPRKYPPSLVLGPKAYKIFADSR